MDASSQGSVTKSSSKLDKETQGEDAESCSSKDHPISEKTSKQSTSTSDQKGKLITGPVQSMQIDDRKINRSIDDNRLITVD